MGKNSQATKPAAERRAAAIYCRISSDDEALQLGVKRQEADCRALCEREGFQVAGLYVDNDRTAADPTKRRPEYERMMGDIRRGLIDTVVVSVVDRLQRQPSELESFVVACKEAHMRKVIPTKAPPTDLDDPDALYMLREQVNRAAWEIGKMRQRAERKHLELAEGGKYHGGRRPFGYEADGVTIRESEAALIREAAERIISGATVRSIRLDFERRGKKTAQGLDHWAPATFRNILTNPRIAGLRVHQGEVIGEAAWPAILDRETFDQLQVILENPDRRPSRTGVLGTYVLRGLLRCSLCSHLMVGQPNPRPTKTDPARKVRYYRCHVDSGGCGKVAVMSDNVEAEVISRVLALVDNPKVRAIASAEDEAVKEQIRELVASNAEDEAALARLEDAFADGALTKAGLQRNSKKFRGSIEARNAKLAELEGRSALSRYPGQINEHWDDLDMDERRMILSSLLSSVEVKKPTNRRRGPDPERLTFCWRLGPVVDLALRMDDLEEWGTAGKAWRTASQEFERNWTEEDRERFERELEQRTRTSFEQWQAESSG